MDNITKPIYLDNAASTPLLDEVTTEILPYLKWLYGNPSSLHRLGRESFQAVEKARSRVASLIGAKKKEIVFTSGGTEANNLAIKGISNRLKRIDQKRNCVIASSIEHESVLGAVRDLEKNGFNVLLVPTTTNGQIEPENLKKTIPLDGVALVSIMLSNNEVGTIQPVKELAAITHQYGGLFHTDAVQAIGKIPVDVKLLDVDLLSMSSHKIHGPKGVGALYLKEGLMLDPIVSGGGQESDFRSGTENVHGIIGFAKACDIMSSRLEEHRASLVALRDYLIFHVLDKIPDSRVNCSTEERIPNIAHFTFMGVQGEDLVTQLDEHGIAASTGSACSSKHQKPSHVLKAMGFSYAELTGSLRLSISILNTKGEIDRVIPILADIIAELRTHSPFGKSK
jgi:cysteine desulfurase